MNYINTLSHSAPINNAIKIIQQLSVTHKLNILYRRSSRNDLIFIGFATFITLYNLISYIKERRRRLNEPPMVPYGLPFIGHALYISLMPKKFIDWCNKNYGELYNIVSFGSTVTIASGISAQESLKASMEDLNLDEATGKDLLHMHYVFNDEARYLGRKALPSVAKMVISNAKIHNYIPSIQQGLEVGLKKNFNQNGPTVVNKPSNFLQHLVGYMSVPSLLGEEFANNVEVIDSFAEFTGDIIKNIPIWMTVPKLFHPVILPFMHSMRKHHHIMHKHVVPVVHERREKIRQAREAGVDHGLEENFLTSMIEFVLRIDENGEPVYYNDSQIIDGILNIAFAAVHTSSSNISFCLYWLIARPDLKEKLLEEMERVMPGKSPVTQEGLSQMKFMNNFIRESLRQGADVLSNSKKAMRDYTFANGYQVPKGRTVQTTSRQLNFGNNTNRFTIEEMDPDMSLDRSSTSPAKDFITFGMGKHLCPGRFFAVQEIEMTLLYLLKNFEINTTSGKKPYPIKFFSGIIALNREDPLIFTPK